MHEQEIHGGSDAVLEAARAPAPERRAPDGEALRAMPADQGHEGAARSEASRTAAYGRLLERAYEIRESDGAYFVGNLQLEDDVDSGGGCVHGRDPDRFAELLWGERPGCPPAGLTLNAPLWYRAGYRHAVAAATLGLVAGTTAVSRVPGPRTDGDCGPAGCVR